MKQTAHKRPPRLGRRKTPTKHSGHKRSSEERRAQSANRVDRLLRRLQSGPQLPPHERRWVVSEIARRADSCLRIVID